ncbi:MAG: glycerol-3-phosphate dehydrogenase [Myxococcota bacterium]|nr:glycerol-3-phosphate dehydrogenase [Myxococcota bacterium]
MMQEDRKGLSEQEYDVLIIGGGITGAGAARDAAMRGLKTLMVDMNDLAFGTSSRSSKLVHGGLRYLEHAEFALVFESVSERRILMKIAPHLVRAQGFLFPVFSDSRRSLLEINIGMWLYDGLSLFRSPKMHKSLSKKKLKKQEPSLRQEDLKGAPQYYDCATDDARLTLESALDAVAHGATVATYVKVLGFVKNEQNRIAGVRVLDRFTGEEKEIRARAVVNATGPWSDRLRGLKGEEIKKRLRPTKGIHIVVPTEKLSLNNAIVCFHPEDGRVLFAIPWGDRTYIGTTDTDYQSDPGDVAASGEDVRYLINVSNHYFPTAHLEEGDVISTWAGVRPWVADENSDDESAVSREHVLKIESDGLITSAGGKLTTYRKMGAEVVDKAIEYLRAIDRLPGNIRNANTAQEALPGAIGWPENGLADIMHQIQTDAGEVLKSDTIQLLAETYGVRGKDVGEMAKRDASLQERLNPERPEIMAQVKYAVEKELAKTIRDVLIRRTQVFFRETEQGLNCLDRVAEEMAALLNWDEAKKQEEIEAYKEEVERSRRWRDE